MPITVPQIDSRTYQQLLDEALARIPVHTREWTNFNESDPGVTLIEVFAFLTENLIYRANLIPERNRRKFLQLLSVPLAPASPARGIVAVANERGPGEPFTLPAETEVRAGQVPFRLERGLDVLPVEARAYFKRKVINPDQQLIDYYNLLYASTAEPGGLDFYQTVLLDGTNLAGVDLNAETVDGSLWIALLVRPSEQPADATPDGWRKLRDEVRDRIRGKTLNVGLIPVLETARCILTPVGSAQGQDASAISYYMPKLPPEGKLPTDPEKCVAEYRALNPHRSDNVLTGPGIVELTLPSSIEALSLWTNLDPLESGVGDFPPALDDTAVGEKVLTWLRIRPSSAANARFLWAGINAMTVTQCVRVWNERLEPGTGMPDQVRKLSHRPVVPSSLTISVTSNGRMETWTETDDLLAAGGEIPSRDQRLPLGTKLPKQAKSEVFLLDAEAGEIRFGDGMRGKRPQAGAELRASYDHCLGNAGNVGKGAINLGSALPAGFTVTNPIPTWLGADAENVDEGEKQISYYVHHRDRLVTQVDFETIARRAPGIEIGRIEVLPAFHPDLSPNEPGDAPGVVTLMVIPRYDPKQPDAPQPDQLFLDALCHHLDPRRLVTTELVLRGPVYRDLWLSVGIGLMGGHAVAEVREALKRRLTEYLAPVRRNPVESSTGFEAGMEKGWPLRRSVTQRQLMAEASRVPGVLQVNDLLVAEGESDPLSEISLKGLELPRLAGISVVVGDPSPLGALRGAPTEPTDVQPSEARRRMVSVPVVPEEC